MNLEKTFKELKQLHLDNNYPERQERLNQLKRLLALVQQHAEELAEAVSKDFAQRAREESLVLEIYPTVKAIQYCIRHCSGWMKKRRRHASWLYFPAYCYLYPQPLGVIGVMSPWNYPIYLALIPAAYALAAGNRVMVKMSELSTHTGKLLIQLLKQADLDHHIQIINGDVAVSKVFAQLPFDHLIFTGSTPVGKLVMRAASENLTPVTLELGGKSPAVISPTVNPDHLGRLVMGKLFNAGQTCIAPDFLMIPTGWQQQLVERIKALVDGFYPHLLDNPNYSGIVNQHHRQRLMSLLEDAREKGAEVIAVGETTTDNTAKLPLYLVFKVNSTMRIMQEEIFGPIWPVMTWQNFSEVLAQIRAMPHPLALYYFGQDQQEMRQLRAQTLSGALSINETVIHISVDDLPFGGVGASGMGNYHGREGFDSLSCVKPVFVQRRFSAMKWLYPPYGRFLHFFLRWMGGIRIKK